MNFDWSEDQKLLHQQVVEFAQKKLNDKLIEEDREHLFSREKWDACASMGLMGLPIPGEYGGLGLDALTCAFVLEGLGYGCKENGLFLSLGAHLWAVEMPILLYGSDELKKRFLPKLSSGEWIGAHAMSEAGSGSDAMALSTRADLDGDTYILNGRKTFVSNAPVCDVIVTFATHNKKHGFAAVSGFVLERDTPGVSIESKVDKMGTRTSAMADVVFENVRVPVSQRIGPANFGYKIFAKAMQWERGLILAPLVGAMQRTIEECVAYANLRQQFGKRIAAYQAISGKIVDMQVRLEAARLLTYKAAWALDHGDAAIPASAAKLVTSEAAVQTFADAIQVFGGYGYTTDLGIERHLRDAIGAKIYSGTSEMQKMIIATALGLKTQ